jgi:hypothetical protein
VKKHRGSAWEAGQRAANNGLGIWPGNNEAVNGLVSLTGTWRGLLSNQRCWKAGDIDDVKRIGLEDQLDTILLERASKTYDDNL